MQADKSDFALMEIFVRLSLQVLFLLYPEHVANLTPEAISKNLLVKWSNLLINYRSTI